MQWFVINTTETKALALGLKNFNGDVFKMGKRGDVKLECCCINVRLTDGEWSICVGMLKVDCIWRDLVNWEVVESFIKSSMSGNFDTGCFRVMPKDVASGALHTLKENATLEIGLKLCCLFPWRLDPCPTSKGPKVGEILNDIGGFCNW